MLLPSIAPNIVPFQYARRRIMTEIINKNRLVAFPIAPLFYISDDERLRSGCRCVQGARVATRHLTRTHKYPERKRRKLNKRGPAVAARSEMAEQTHSHSARTANIFIIRRFAIRNASRSSAHRPETQFYYVFVGRTFKFESVMASAEHSLFIAQRRALRARQRRKCLKPSPRPLSVCLSRPREAIIASQSPATAIGKWCTAKSRTKYKSHRIISVVRFTA